MAVWRVSGIVLVLVSSALLGGCVSAQGSWGSEFDRESFASCMRTQGWDIQVVNGELSGGFGGPEQEDSFLRDSEWCANVAAS